MTMETFDELNMLCLQATPEGLNLEFKLKEDPSNPTPSKADKRSIAEAIVSFANSDGGTLICGIESEKRDGIDVATRLAPIAEVEKFAASLRLVVELNVSPEIHGVVVHTILKNDVSLSGFVVCHVPRSDHRPHMSTAPNVHRYYRRSFTGSSVMTPSEIRDQILATREAVLQPVIVAGGGAGFSDYRDWISATPTISFKLRNIGSRLCREPFLRVSASCNLTSHSYYFDPRLTAWKTQHQTGTLIHVDDELHCMSLNFLARIDIDNFFNPENLTVDKLLETVTIFPGSDQHEKGSFEADGLDSIELIVTYGAENATVRTEKKLITRLEIAQRLISAGSSVIRDMLSPRIGTWRQDVFDIAEINLMENQKNHE